MLHRVKGNIVNLYGITEAHSFPVDITAIHSAIYSLGYEIHHVQGLEESCIIGKKLICQKFETTKELRVARAHELGHILLHDCRTGYCKFNKTQEKEADVFAMYFTMPPKTFESDMRTYTYLQLADKYGVPLKYVKMRVAIAGEMVS